MGLCKCPKRKATNLFCFEHRVNVCEYCLVDVHESCVVQTYLSWLTDSDYDPKCLLCSEPLSSKQTVRLKCFHNFHWSCLSNRVGNLPIGTPTGAFKCPSCLDTIFPALNQTSPVIERLREKLSTVNWARAGLGLDVKPGLDVVSETAFPKKSFSVDMGFDSVNSSHTTSRMKQAPSVAVHSSRGQDSDHNDLKYQKRNSGLKLIGGRLPKTVKRVLLAVLVLVCFYLLLIFAGRDSLQNDRLFDPHANPNIRVESNPL